MVGYWLHGAALGFSIAAPVGPIGVLCIRRTLADGRLVGFVSGLGAATADGFYGAVAAFGLTAVSGLLIGQRLWIQLVGGLFLAYLGVRTLLRAPAEKPASAANRRGLAGAYASTLGLTLTNPATILSFVAVFAGLGLAGARAGGGETAVLVLGVFCGSALWWLVLSSGVGLLRARIGSQALRWVHRVSGTILLGFGVVALVSLVSLPG
jgi:threonine/homoserine/homoserine lactone efflux protein